MRLYQATFVSKGGKFTHTFPANDWESALVIAVDQCQRDEYVTKVEELT